MISDCITCGCPTFRREHADWCVDGVYVLNQTPRCEARIDGTDIGCELTNPRHKWHRWDGMNWRRVEERV
jgi:hypothetical protein